MKIQMTRFTRLIIIALMGISSFSATAQCPVASPVPQCIEVKPNGDVKITFTPSAGVPFNPGIPQEGFEYYQLEHSLSSTGPFDSVASNYNLNSDTFLHPGLNHSQMHFYRILTFSQCDNPFVPSTFIKTVSPAPYTVFSTVMINSSVTDDTLINLTWNQSGLPDPMDPTGYHIFRDFPIGSGFVDYTSGIPYGTESYTDNIHVCNDQAVYRINITNTTANCVNVSVPDTVDIVDLTPPDMQAVDSVSFNHSTNKPIIGWTRNAHNDVGMYVIVVCHPGGGYDYLDTVPSGVFFYVDDTEYDGTQSLQYSVYAVDLCGNASTDFGTDCHNTIFLSTEIDVCEETVELLWNPYDDFNSGVDVLYQVWVSEGGGKPVLVGTTKDTRFLHEDPRKDAKLKYHIRAIENDGAGPFTASSNLVEVATEFLRPPTFSYLRNVTVVAPNRIRSELYVDIDSDVSEFRVKRSHDTLLENFITVGTIRLPPRKTPSDSISGYIDETVNTDLNNYYYLYEALDSCGRSLDTSNIVSSMRLRIEANSTSRINTLVWNNFLGWEGDVFGYRIYRSQDGVPDRDPVITVFPRQGQGTSYADDISELTNNAEGNFCYYVEAIEDEPTFPRLNSAISKSNEVCVNQLPQIYIPTAFTPEGNNPVFKPVFVFADLNEYELIIFNRYGEIVYETTNINGGWNGRLGNNIAPSGVYVYQIRYRAITGQKFLKRGTLTLLK
jgi:gliding motility-associated-like protein